MGSLLGEGGKNECGTRWRRGESWRQVETRGREAWRCVRTGKKQPMATWPWFYAPGRKWGLHLDRERGFEEGSKGLPSELPRQSRGGLLSSKRTGEQLAALLNLFATLPNSYVQFSSSHAASLQRKVCWCILERFSITRAFSITFSLTRKSFSRNLPPPSIPVSQSLTETCQHWKMQKAAQGDRLKRRQKSHIRAQSNQRPVPLKASHLPTCHLQRTRAPQVQKRKKERRKSTAQSWRTVHSEDSKARAFYLVDRTFWNLNFKMNQ